MFNARHKQSAPLLLLVVALIFFIFFFISGYGILRIQQIPERIITTSYIDCQRDKPFLCAIAARASSDRHIILAVVDNAFIDMAFNLYESSFRAHDISNFLFVGIGNRTCEALVAASVPCFYYGDVVGYDDPSDFNSPGFLRKVTVKVDMMLDALTAGYSVLLTDVDLVYLKNPVPILKEAVRDGDMAAMMDVNDFNSGFIIVKPTTCSIRVWNGTRAAISVQRTVNDQEALNSVIKKTRASNVTGCASLKVAKLDSVRFSNGMNYFSNPLRSFPENRSECFEKADVRCTFVVHNNFIIGYAAKVYRFKEYLLWIYDKDGYYSNASARYLTYENPIQLLWSSAADIWREQQLKALKSALVIGRVLNRIVILPRFHCKSSNRFIDCPLSSLVKITPFDNQFGASYRESSFLLNRQVPDSVRYSVSSRFDSVVRDNRVSSSELIDRFSRASESILPMGPLFDVRISLDFSKDDELFKSAIAKGFVLG